MTEVEVHDFNQPKRKLKMKIETTLPGKSEMKNVTVTDKKASTGTDWRMSSNGTKIFSANLFLAAR